MGSAVVELGDYGKAFIFGSRNRGLLEVIRGRKAGLARPSPGRDARLPSLAAMEFRKLVGGRAWCCARPNRGRAPSYLFCVPG